MLLVTLLVIVCSVSAMMHHVAARKSDASMKSEWCTFRDHFTYSVEALNATGPQVKGMGLRDQIGPNSSSKTSPNHASNTAISASVIGTCVGQSSMTRHCSTSCLGGRPRNGHGSPSSCSSCSDAVGSCWRGFRDIAPESAMRAASGTTHAFAGLRFVSARADRGDGWAMPSHGGSSAALAALSQPCSLVRRKSVLPSRRTPRSRRMGGGGQDLCVQRRPQGMALKGASRPPTIFVCVIGRPRCISQP